MESLETTQLMSIGRFARLTGLTMKALRHYDDLGLLRPAAVDPETGYRSYSSAQVGRAEAIRLLRRLEVPLDHVSMLIATEDPAVVRSVLIDGKESVMGTQAEALDWETQRRLAADCFNKTWTLMEKQDRTRAEDDEMLHCAHASAYHWHQVGTAANRARGEWQCSRVYTVLGRTEPALHHARRCLEIVEASPSEMEEWDLPAAYEALGRAYSVAGNVEESRRYVELGREATAKIEDEDDRKQMESDFATIAP
jgi:DNA-binding transcriptional MerR regulator